MAEGRQDPPLPEISEQIHLPGPSYIPVVLAAGVTIAVVGVVLTWVLFAIGMIIFLVSLIRWIQDTRRDISELPLEHGH
jgi:type IV secretory pathway TrbD component